MNSMEHARHTLERGQILRALQTEFVNPTTSVHSLYRALDLLGYSMTMESLSFHLVLLEGLGYVQIWRVRDTPSYRRDRPSDMSPNAILFAHLTPKGLALIDGNIPEDPQVSF